MFEAPVIDAAGQKRIVQTQAYSKGFPRSAEKLEGEMLRRGKIKKGRVGNSRLLLVTAADVVVWPASSTARAVRLFEPFPVAVVFQSVE